MELKVLNSILFRELMPWTFDSKDINEKLKKIRNMDPVTDKELLQQLQILLSDYSDLSKWLEKQNSKNTIPLKHHCFAIDFPDYHDAVTKYYSKIISYETLRVYNAFISKIQKYDKKVDIVYHTTNALKNIKALTINTVKEIKERGFEEIPNEQSSLSHFVLHLLRQHLTVLFFDIQELSNESVSNPINIEDFYLLELKLPKKVGKEIKKIDKNLDTVNAILTNELPNNIDAFTEKPKLSFGWKNGKVSQLENLFDDLCVDFNFLDQDKTSVEALINILTTKEIIASEINIYLGCNTTVFVFIMDNISKCFQRLTPSNIEKSKSFWSKALTNKNAVLIKSDNFYKTRGKSKMNSEIQTNILETIQRYFP
jgi:hypothetical protein